MAVVFRAVGTKVETANNVVASTTLSPISPASAVDGDLLVCFTVTNSITAACATPSGWTLVTGFPKTSGTAGGGRVYVFTRLHASAAADDPAVAWTGLTTGTSGSGTTAIIAAWAGATATLDGTVQFSDLAAQTTTSIIPAFTTATSKSVVIGMAVKFQDLAGTSTVATFTERGDWNTVTGSGHYAEVSELVMGAAGSSGTATVTWSSATSGRAIAVSLGFTMAARVGAVVDALTNSFTTVGTAQPLPRSTATARISLAAGSTPTTRTLHSIKVRARTTAGAGTIRAALYEGSTLITDTAPGYLESAALTTSLADYSLAIADADAAAIGSYSDLEVRIWGYAAGGGLITFEIAKIELDVPVAAAGSFGAVVDALTFGSTTAAKVFKRAAVVDALTLGSTTVGRVTRKGAVVTALADSVTTGPARATLKGAVVDSLADLFTTQGRRAKVGASVVSLVDSFTTQAKITAKAAVADALADSITTVGKVTAKAASATSLTDGITTQGVRAKVGAAVAALVDSFTTVGRVAAKGASDSALVLSRTTAGVRALRGLVVGALTDTITTQGTASSGHVTQFGASVVSLTDSLTTVAKVTAKSAVVFPINAAAVTAGYGTHKGAVVFPLTLERVVGAKVGAKGAVVTPTVLLVVTQGAVQGAVSGAIISPYTLVAQTLGRVGVRGSVVTPIALGRVTAGSVAKWGAVATSLALSAQTIGTLYKRGQVVVPLSVAISDSGTVGIRGISTVALVLSVTVYGHIEGELVLLDPIAAGYIGRGLVGSFQSRVNGSAGESERGSVERVLTGAGVCIDEGDVS